MNSLQLALGYIEQIGSACPRGWAGSTLPSPPPFAAESCQYPAVALPSAATQPVGVGRSDVI